MFPFSDSSSSSSPDDTCTISSCSGQMEQWDLIETINAVFLAPSYHIVFELILLFCIVALIFKKTSKPNPLKLSDREKLELIRDWVPEPLAPKVTGRKAAAAGGDGVGSQRDHHHHLIEGKVCRYLQLKDGLQLLNMASLNFLSLNGHPTIEKEAVKTMRRYGVGSCGPRGFYGTVDVHLDLETRLALFTGTQEAIVYSYSFATIASAIPAYSKRTDIIYCDEGVNFAIQKGIDASRSKVKYFRHNDMLHLKQLLQEQYDEDLKDIRKARATRKFLIVEGIYQNYADICPLPELVRLKNEYKLRLFIDESISFGTLGKTGRGVTEHFNVPMSEVDLMTASLENSLASTGGFACGKTFIIDHQRLSAQGYCFSASTPPMLSTASIVALDILDEDAGIPRRLQSNSKYLHGELSQLKNITVEGEVGAPIMHVRLKNKRYDTRQAEVSDLRLIVKKFESQCIAIVQSGYLKQERNIPKPSIRLALSSDLTHQDLDKVVAAFHSL